MDAKRVMNTLRLIGMVYKPILDDSFQYVLPQAIEMIRVTKDQYDWAFRNRTRGITPEPWGYSIQHNSPLRFKTTSVPNSVEMQVDVYCDIKWEETDTPVIQDIKVRVWSDHDETIFDETRDSHVIFEELTRVDRGYQGRVVSRLHFDKANLNSASGTMNHPEYHVQYGGISHRYELCWHPEKVNVPRLIHQPLELFLVCQMVAANFFPEIYRDQIKEKAEWRQELILYQNLILRGYYEKCMGAINSNDSLFDALCI